MNRIVLIGNGFDLAHGMKTSYNDFLDYLWREVLGKAYQNGVAGYQNELVSVSNFHGFWEDIDSNESAKRKVERHFSTIHYKNKFFEKVVKRQYVNSWVDIEKEYYVTLTECYKIDQQQQTEASKKQIDQLNADFKVIKNKLNQYLISIEEKFKEKYKDENPEFWKHRKSIGSKIYKRARLKDFAENYINQRAVEKFNRFKVTFEGLKSGKIEISDLEETDQIFIADLRGDFSINGIRNYLLSEDMNGVKYVPVKQSLLLSFNYTATTNFYQHSDVYVSFPKEKPAYIKPIHIHGSIHEEDDNPIIFGYGDELDDDYLDIEKLDDNRYLENIKSVKYLDRDNYKRLLEFVNSDQYQVVIMGHSCGNSDRTLLNTLFEHDNCVSIKPYYHLKKDGSDNYSDIVRNITRNFNDKQKLRDRVVNKQYCEPLL
ncbi:conserved hypothetical protein [Flavobacteria bacterium BBFL7]|nr:conserved hypothetical protein [Flavobacteria bacterium BBFL7]